MKKNHLYSLAGILILSAVTLALCLASSEAELNNQVAGNLEVNNNASDNPEILNNSEASDNDIHTVKLKRIAPIREGDSYGWELTSEQGQLGYSLNALGLNSNDPYKITKTLGIEETTMIYSQDGIDLKHICNKLGLDYEAISSKNIIEINYSQDDIKYN